VNLENEMPPASDDQSGKRAQNSKMNQAVKTKKRRWMVHTQRRSRQVQSSQPALR
jgi:hypothetical protein